MTCFKSLDNPSCIDLFLTNSAQSFQNTVTVTTGLSDFHKMVVTVMKTTFPKAQPRIVYYRAGIKDLEGFRQELRNELRTKPKSYLHFETAFMKVLDKYDPIKQRVVRDNEKPFMTKALRKAIMRRSALKNRFLKSRTDENHKAMKRQKNYTNRLYRRELKKYAGNLDLKSLTDNRKFWDILLPLLSSKGKSS